MPTELKGPIRKQGNPILVAFFVQINFFIFMYGLYFVQNRNMNLIINITMYK